MQISRKPTHLKNSTILATGLNACLSSGRGGREASLCSSYSTMSPTTYLPPPPPPLPPASPPRPGGDSSRMARGWRAGFLGRLKVGELSGSCIIRKEIKQQ